MALDNKPKLHVIIGVGAPDKGGPTRSAPPKFPFGADAPAAGSDKEDRQEASGKKVSAEEAQSFDENTRCGNCDNFQEQTGECKVVEGQWTPDTGCRLYFEPKGSEANEGQQPAGGLGQMAGPAAGGEIPPDYNS